MAYFRLLILFLVCLVLSACGVAAVVSAVGTTITNAAYNSAERELNNPRSSGKDQAFRVAIANMNLGIEYNLQWPRMNQGSVLF